MQAQWTTASICPVHSGEMDAFFILVSSKPHDEAMEVRYETQAGVNW